MHSLYVIAYLIQTPFLISKDITLLYQLCISLFHELTDKINETSIALIIIKNFFQILGQAEMPPAHGLDIHIICAEKEELGKLKAFAVNFMHWKL